MERGDTGLGRDAYGPPRHERDRRGYGRGPYPSDDGYPAEEDDAARSDRRAEAEDDFSGLITRAANGDEIVIEENSAPVAVLRSPVDKRHVRLLSESLRIAKERGSKVTRDGGFEDDLNAIIESHLEPLRDPWA